MKNKIGVPDIKLTYETDAIPIKNNTKEEIISIITDIVNKDDKHKLLQKIVITTEVVIIEYLIVNEGIEDEYCGRHRHGSGRT